MDENDLNALNNATMAEAARLLTLVIGIAAIKHPEEIRKALAQVFDAQATQEASERAVRIATAAQEEAYEVAFRVREMRDELMTEIQAVQKDFDQVRQLAEEIGGKRTKLAQWCERTTKRLTALEQKHRPKVGSEA